MYIIQYWNLKKINHATNIIKLGKLLIKVNLEREDST